MNITITIEEAFELANYASRSMCIFSFSDQEVVHIGKIKGTNDYTLDLDGLVNTIKVKRDDKILCQFMGIGAFFAAVELAKMVLRGNVVSDAQQTRRLALQILEDERTNG